jgi:hypothetical protein
MQNTNRVQWGSSDTASIAGQDGGSGYLALATAGAERAAHRLQRQALNWYV